MLNPAPISQVHAQALIPFSKLYRIELLRTNIKLANQIRKSMSQPIGANFKATIDRSLKYHTAAHS